jgi:hypothetical protein
MDWPNFLSLLVPATLAVLTGWVSGVLAAEQKTREAVAAWHRSREDTAATLLVNLIKDLVAELATVSHNINWLVWRCSGKELTSKEASDSAWFLQERLPKIMATHTALAAFRPEVADRVRSVVLQSRHLANVALEAATKYQDGDHDALARLQPLAAQFNEQILAEVRGLAGAVLEIPRTPKASRV